jgi:AraC-like DNA-binding protein
LQASIFENPVELGHAGGMEESIASNDELPRSWQSPDIPGLELLDGAFRDHVFPRHSHEGLMLSVIDAGAQRLVHAGRSHIAGPGSIVAIPPAEVHSGSAAAVQGWRYRVLTIPGTLLVAAGGEKAKAGFRSSVVIDDRELRRQLSAVHLAFNGMSNLMEREYRLLDALHTFFSRHASPGKLEVRVGREDAAVARAVEFLGHHDDRPVTLTELAANSRLDVYRLARAFTRLIGMPPHAYHLQRRLRTAQQRLASGIPVFEVAHAAGFADQAHFTRHFKRLTGVTPGQYRAAHGHRATRR